MPDVNRGGRREERGATTVFIAAFLTVLLVSMGLSIDVGNAYFQERKMQTSADNSALAIARDCSVGDLLKCSSNPLTGAPATAKDFTDQNSLGASSSTALDVVDSTVRVTVNRNVPFSFMKSIGVTSKNVTTTAKATWAGHPTEGSPMLPLGVPYCLYKNNLPPATTPLLLRSDVVSVVFNVVVQGGVLGRVITTLLGDLVGATEACTNSDGQDVVMLRGPVWLSGIEGTVNGTFHWDSSICNMRLGDINAFVGGASSSLIPSNCVNKLGGQIQRGQVVTLPVYLPANNVLQAGFVTDVCVLRVCSVKVPPRLGVRVIGFAPFRITGWNYPGNAQLDPHAPACSSITLPTHPAAGIGCNGIQGYFLKNMQADPNFTYAPDGLDLGANGVRLSE